MGLLDQKERILDIVYTDKGRELLSKGKLKIKYYAFSDEGINYSGSMVQLNGGLYDYLTSSIASGTTFDQYIHRNLSFEADQRKGYDNQEPLDLSSFLYTVSSNSKVTPKIRFSETGTIELKRTYIYQTISDIDEIPRGFKDAIIKITTEVKNRKDIKYDYGNLQLIRMSEESER